MTVFSNSLAQYILAGGKLLDDVYHGTFDKRHPIEASLFNKQHPLADAAIRTHLHRGHQAALHSHDGAFNVDDLLTANIARITTRATYKSGYGRKSRRWRKEYLNATLSTM